MAGSQERLFSFGQTKWNQKTFFGYSSGPAIPEDPSKGVGGIAIGQNSYARTGSIMLGVQNYKGKMGDADVDSDKIAEFNKLVFSTSLGTNSQANGAFSSIVGAYSIISGNYNGGNNGSGASKNFASVIIGSLNSIESRTASNNYSGVANSIVGTANRTFNSNGSLIFGAGNEITNSVKSIYELPQGAENKSAADFMKELRESVRKNSGGATLAIGGGNKDRKSTRLNSSHANISYAVFCLKKKK